MIKIIKINYARFIKTTITWRTFLQRHDYNDATQVIETVEQTETIISEVFNSEEKLLPDASPKNNINLQEIS